jgi:hypothetical protein
MAGDLLAKLLQKGNEIARDQAGAVPHKKPEGRDEKHDRHPVFGCRFERANGDGCGMIYGALLGLPYWNPSKDIQLVFEGAYQEKWRQPEFGVWLVSIEGGNLESVWRHLCVIKETFVREKDEDGETRTITVEPWVLKGCNDKPKEG